jgi:hypothetical protein
VQERINQHAKELEGQKEIDLEKEKAFLEKLLLDMNKKVEIPKPVLETPTFYIYTIAGTGIMGVAGWGLGRSIARRRGEAAVQKFHSEYIKSR